LREVKRIAWGRSKPEKKKQTTAPEIKNMGKTAKGGVTFPNILG
jgi:hypothetical protein